MTVPATTLRSITWTTTCSAIWILANTQAVQTTSWQIHDSRAFHSVAMRADHKRSDLRLEDFVPAASEAIDTGTGSGRVPAYDIVGEERPQGAATDRGVFEATP